ncbi:MAG: AMP-binding protein [Anaerolineae bacterium]|nr:AMP-binding protein [Anaerolineae bacterium]
MKITLLELIAAQAQTHQQATAILGLNRPTLTYARLFEQVQRIGQQLHALGLHRHSRIALVLPNGPEAAVAFVCIASHMICAPLNPSYSAHEFDFYLADLQADALVVIAQCQSAAITIAHKRHIPILYLAGLSENTAGLFNLTTSWSGKNHTTHDVAAADDIALLLHTSGTTSRPKLVPLTHANLCASAQHIRHTLQLVPQDRCLNIMPLFHIHGLVASLLASLSAGASVFCVNEVNPDYFNDWLRYHPTWYTAVPTLHQAIVHHITTQNNVSFSHHFRFIRSSSAALPAQVLGQLESLFNVPVIEAYGMTEAAHQMASNPLPPGLRKIGSVGLPAGPAIVILDETGTILPAMQVGEIAIRGDNVISGYCDNPAANEQAFCNGWFRTGDQGYLDSEGYLYINGRLKEIINRGGEKISPREVDDVLLSHSAVAQAVTFALPHPTLGETVAAAVKLQAGSSVDEPTLRHFASQSLATFKIPERIIFVEEIPKGATGKLQRIGLAEKLGVLHRFAGLQANRQTYVAPRTNLETSIAEIWQQVLTLSPIGIHDRFLDLGGDSIRATQIMARISNQFNVAISPHTLLAQPTIADMALAITQYRAQNIDMQILAHLLDEVEALT